MNKVRFSIIVLMIPWSLFSMEQSHVNNDRATLELLARLEQNRDLEESPPRPSKCGECLAITSYLAAPIVVAGVLMTKITYPLLAATSLLSASAATVFLMHDENDEQSD